MSWKSIVITQNVQLHPSISVIKHKPLYKTYHYNTILDTRFEARYQKYIDYLEQWP